MTYFQRIVHLSATEALVINSINIVVLLILIPASGALSDRVCRKPVLLSASLGMLLVSWPFFWLLDHPSFLMALLQRSWACARPPAHHSTDLFAVVWLFEAADNVLTNALL